MAKFNNQNSNNNTQEEKESFYSSISKLMEYANYCDIDDGENVDDQTNIIIKFKLIIVRYKLYHQSQCNIPLEIIISSVDQKKVLFQRMLLPSVFEDDKFFYSDDCDCPHRDWPRLMQCNTLEANRKLARQIKKDLE